MTAKQMSTVSMYFILACMYLTIPALMDRSHQQATDPMAVGSTSAIDEPSSRFQDVNILCKRRPEWCQSAGQLVKKVNEGARKIYDWNS
jgi:hypothetical protein